MWLMKLLRVFLFFLLGSAPLQSFATTVDSLLTELNQTLARKESYDAQRLKRISVLTTEFAAYTANDTKKFNLGLRIYDEYKSFKYDSAFAYGLKITRLAEQLHDPEKVEVAKLKMAFILLSSGMFKETFETLGTVATSRLTKDDKLHFYFLKSRAYSDLGNFTQDNFYQPVYYAKSLAYADTALQFGRSDSYEYLLIQEFIAQKTGNLPAGIAAYEQIRRLPRLLPHQIAVSASTIADIYEATGQPEKSFALLLQAAIADVQTATKETVALFKLSNYCYQRGDLKNAYTFIKEAREEAAFYKARQRQVEFSHISAVIEGEKINIIESQRKSLKTYSVIVTLLALSIIGFALIIFTQLRKLQKAGKLIYATNQELRSRNEELRQLNDGLNEANIIKEEYIGYYFHNNSRYIDKIESLKKSLDTLLGSKQYVGVQRLVDGINIKKERNELFKGFDTVFLQIFPHFVAQFNTLFGAADHIQLTEDQLLNTELRIFALIRLGISDSEQIGRMLGYSINTIYTYKTRVKNRSVLPNEEFEARVLAIRAVQ